MRTSNPTYSTYDLKLSWWQYVSSSRAISRVNVELEFDETAFVSITGRWWVLSSHAIFKHAALVHLSLDHVGTGHQSPSEAAHRSSRSLLSVFRAHTPLTTWTHLDLNRDSLWNVRHQLAIDTADCPIRLYNTFRYKSEHLTWLDQSHFTHSISWEKLLNSLTFKSSRSNDCILVYMKTTVFWDVTLCGVLENICNSSKVTRVKKKKKHVCKTCRP